MAHEKDASFPRSGGSATWASLECGDRLNVVKLAPGGSDVARYPGTVIARENAGEWVVVQAVWEYQQIDVAGLTFAPDDVLKEWFSPHHDFNAFALHTANGVFKGWYANVTYPARLNAETAPPTLSWHDLYVDVIAMPDGTTIVCDEDELAASGLEKGDPRLHRRILRARDEILHRLDRRVAPFGSGPKSAP